MKKNLPLKKARLPARQDSEENRNLAFNYSLKYLSFRPRSIKEIKDYLTRKNFMEKTIEPTMEKLIELKFLNDEEFAKMWIEERQRIKGKSKFALKLELLNKGLDKDLIEQLLKIAENDFETAKALFEKKKYKLKGLSKLEFKKKMSGLLLRRGFSFEIINKLLKED